MNCARRSRFVGVGAIWHMSYVCERDAVHYARLDKFPLSTATGTNCIKLHKFSSSWPVNIGTTSILTLEIPFNLANRGFIRNSSLEQPSMGCQERFGGLNRTVRYKHLTEGDYMQAFGIINS